MECESRWLLWDWVVERSRNQVTSLLRKEFAFTEKSNNWQSINTHVTCELMVVISQTIIQCKNSEKA